MNELSVIDELFLSEPLDTLLQRSLTSKLSSLEKFRALIAILIRYPEEKWENLALISTKYDIDFGLFFRCSAMLGNCHLFDNLVTNLPLKTLEEIIRQDYPQMFILAAENGHLEVLQWLKQNTQQVSQLSIKTKAFPLAAKNGHLEVLKWIKEETSESELEDMIEADEYYACCFAAINGHLEVVEWLRLRLKEIRMLKYPDLPDNIDAMLTARRYYAFRYAVQHLEVIKWLKKNIASHRFEDMIKADEYSAFSLAYESGYSDTVNFLLKEPVCFAHAELHIDEYGELVQNFIEQKLAALHQQQQALLILAPTEVFDLLSPQKISLFYYIIRHLIRRNEQNFNDELRFLLSIPALKSRAHQLNSNSKENELLLLALRCANREACSILINIPDIRQLAEQHNYYPKEQQGGLDLRALVQDQDLNPNFFFASTKAIETTPQTFTVSDNKNFWASRRIHRIIEADAKPAKPNNDIHSPSSSILRR